MVPAGADRDDSILGRFGSGEDEFKLGDCFRVGSLEESGKDFQPIDMESITRI